MVKTWSVNYLKNVNCHETWSLKSMKRIGKSSLNEVCSMKLMLRMSTSQFGKTLGLLIMGRVPILVADAITIFGGSPPT